MAADYATRFTTRPSSGLDVSFTTITYRQQVIELLEAEQPRHMLVMEKQRRFDVVQEYARTRCNRALSCISLVQSKDQDLLADMHNDKARYQTALEELNIKSLLQQDIR